MAFISRYKPTSDFAGADRQVLWHHECHVGHWLGVSPQMHNLCRAHELQSIVPIAMYDAGFTASFLELSQRLQTFFSHSNSFIEIPKKASGPVAAHSVHSAHWFAQLATSNKQSTGRMVVVAPKTFYDGEFKGDKLALLRVIASKKSGRVALTFMKHNRTCRWWKRFHHDSFDVEGRKGGSRACCICLDSRAFGYWVLWWCDQLDPAQAMQATCEREAQPVRGVQLQGHRQKAHAGCQWALSSLQYAHLHKDVIHTQSADAPRP
ncbi:UNVERIFIED_CONTAM: hypothetical protein PYX00_011549 [Menopon gallinae]|uniref:Uncharacterized protein n=1 Tax=Menopon gallinae TaxID=328185 RepID=A0AAW2H7X9_9NEOP